VKNMVFKDIREKVKSVSWAHCLGGLLEGFVWGSSFRQLV
jgi:hypothetical protein